MWAQYNVYIPCICIVLGKSKGNEHKNVYFFMQYQIKVLPLYLQSIRLMMKYLIILLLLVSNLPCLAGSNVLERLDETLASSQKYDAVKNEQILKLHKQAMAANTTQSRYSASIKLYEAYRSYKYDSAFVYANKAHQLALQLKNPNFIVESSCAKVFCLLSAGLYKEAFDEVEAVDISKASSPYKYKYYFVEWRLLADIADYSRAEPYMEDYIKQSRLLVDTLKNYMRPQSTEYNYILGMQLMKEKKTKESEAYFKKVLQDKHLTMHDRAISTSCLGWLYKLEGQNDKALEYWAEAAICDIKSSTKETTALCHVGTLLYAKGDVDDAIRYVQKAMDDANFYDARQRKIEIGDILPVIQQSQYKDMQVQRNVMMLCVAMACTLWVVLAFGTYLIRKQMKKLRQVKNTIEERNARLEQANSTIEERNLSLEQTNAQLSEANKIKTEYIGKSFYTSAGYFEKLEKLYKSIDHQLAARQYESIRRSLSERSLMNERKNMYEDFDETFLRLFPDFVEKYNQLFDEKDRKETIDRATLSSEMRIFALIRLGVSDSERIAHFLNYSVNTINTYKTRVKNKSIVNNDEFEQRIMEI